MVWGRARLKSSSLAINKSLESGQQTRNGKKGSDARLM